jgi:hypothetical protein
MRHCSAVTRRIAKNTERILPCLAEADESRSPPSWRPLWHSFSWSAWRLFQRQSAHAPDAVPAGAPAELLAQLTVTVDDTGAQRR